MRWSCRRGNIGGMEHPLRSYRRKAGLTQDDLAQRLNVKKFTVSRWEAGKRCPSLDLIRRIRNATNGEVTADDFLPPESTSGDAIAVCPHCGDQAAGKTICADPQCPLPVAVRAGEAA